MNILITGGAGYLGVHLLSQLIKFKTANIIVLDDHSNSDPKILNNFQKNRIKLVSLSISNYKKLEKVFEEYNINYVYHLAAKIDAKESIRKKKLYMKINYICTKNLIYLSNKYKVKKFFFASSAAVYGNAKNKYCAENNKLLPINPYGKSKQYSENFIISNLDITKFYIFRIFNLIGLDQKYYKFFKHRKSVYFQLLNIFKSKKNFFFKVSRYTKNGKLFSTERDFIDVQDVSKVLAKALFMKKSNLIVNVGKGKPISIIELVNLFEDTFNFKIKVLNKNKENSDPKSVIALTKNFNKYFKVLKIKDIKKTFKYLKLIIDKKRAN